MGEPTPTIGWRRREDGMIVTWDLPAGAECVPMPTEEQHAAIDAVEARWGDLCRQVAAEVASPIPDGVCQAHVWRESNGNARAFRREPAQPHELTPLTGVGLGQITSHELKGRHRVQAMWQNQGMNELGEPIYAWVGGYTDEQLFDPKLNLTIAMKYMGGLWRKYDGDFPRVSAAYNAGSVRASQRNPWGMVMTTGHVQAEVCAYNYWLSKRMADQSREAALAFAKNFGPLELRDDTIAGDGEPTA